MSNATVDFETEYAEGFLISPEGIMLGADSLQEAADMVRAYADFLDELAEGGFKLDRTIDEDGAIATKS